MRKNEAKVLEEIRLLLDYDSVDPGQFRRGLESVHDIIHNDVYICGQIMNDKHHGDLEETYKRIIQYSIYAICTVQDSWGKQDPLDLEPVDTIIQETEELIDSQQELPTPIKYGEKVEENNEYSEEVNKQLTQLDQLTTQIRPTVFPSKNQRRKR
jgi:hypothetical protein